MSVFQYGNQYSIFVKKNCPWYKICFWFPRGGGARNLITLVSGAFLFMDKSEHFILVLLCKTNLEYREIFWSPSYISIANFDFLFYNPDLDLRYK